MKTRSGRVQRTRRDAPPEEELRHVAARATRLLEMATALSEATSVSEVAAVVLEKGLSVAEAKGCILVTASFDILGVRGFGDEIIDRIKNDRDGPLPAVMRTREPVWFESLAEMRRLFPNTLAREEDIPGLFLGCSIPLIHAKEVVGAIGLTFVEAKAFGAVDRAFTLLLAQETAGALHRAISFDAERQARRDAELLAQGRAEMMGIVAHDLRNPLNVIAMSNELSLDTPSSERRRLVDMNSRAVKQMQRLIDDLLDNLRLQSGTLSVQLVDVSVQDALRQADAQFCPVAEKHHVELDVGDAPDGLCVRADPLRVAQIIGNLLGNALKFVPENGHVSLYAEREGPQVVFRVQDSGPGIAPDHVAHLFDKFWRAGKGDRRGLGLGLTIAKGLVEAQGGRIWVESSPEVGSTFSFALPIAGE